MKRSILITALLSFVLLMSYVFVLDGESNLGRLSDVVFCESHSSGVKLSDVKGIEASFYSWCETNGEQDASFFCWSEVNDQEIYQLGLSRMSKVDVLVGYGDITLLTHDKRDLKPVDQTGCALSRAASVELFGTSETIGLQLEYDVDIFTIQSIVAYGDPTLLLSVEEDAISSGVSGDAVLETGDRKIEEDASETLLRSHYRTDDMSFDNAVVSGSDACVQQFMSLFSSDENDRLNYKIYQSFGAVCTTLLPLLLMITLSVYAIRLVLSFRTRPFLCILISVGSIVFVFVFCFVCVSIFHDLPLFEPNYWPDILGGWADSAQMVLLDAKSFAELPYWSSAIRCALGSLGAMIAFLLLTIHQTTIHGSFHYFEGKSLTTTNYIFVEMIAIAVAEIAVIVIAGCLGLSLEHGQLLAFMLPLFLLGIHFSHARYVDGE